MNKAKRIELLERVYRKLPALHCKGLCHDACGPIGGTELEIERLERAAGKKLSVDAHGVCSMLTEAKRCSAYGARPMVCRLYGMVQFMRCPHGCVPERFVSDAESTAMFERLHHSGGPPRYSELPKP